MRRHGGDGALQHLQQGLLDALARDVAGDRRVLAPAGHLVDLVDVDDAAFGLPDVVAGRPQQLDQDVLDVLADVAGLGEGGGVGDGEGDVEQAGEGLGEVGLAAAGRADQQDVGRAELDGLGGAPARGGRVEAFVVVVDGHRQGHLGGVLPDDVLIEEVVDLARPGQREVLPGVGGLVFGDEFGAHRDAFVADGADQVREKGTVGC
ncbi:hypothetical protein GCM10010404_92920 [Nonomuraea africana]